MEGGRGEEGSQLPGGGLGGKTLAALQSCPRAGLAAAPPTHQHVDALHGRGIHPAGLERPVCPKMALQGCLLWGEENKGLKSRNRFFAVLHENRWMQQVLCLTLLLPQMLGLCLKLREVKTQHCKQGWGLCPINPAVLHSSRHNGCRLSVVHGAALPLALTLFVAVEHHGQAWGGCSRRQGPMASTAQEMSLASLRSCNSCRGTQSLSCSVLQEPVCPEQPCACQTAHQSVISAQNHLSPPPNNCTRQISNSNEDLAGSMFKGRFSVLLY